MWFWSVVNIKHHIARVVFASASSYQRCLGGKSAKTLNWRLFDAEIKLCVLFSPDGLDYGHQNISELSLLNHVFIRC